MPADRGLYRRILVRIMELIMSPHDSTLAPEQMAKLFTAFAGSKSCTPIERATLFYLKFDGFYPFVDGNDRTGRLFLNLMLM